jgi:hypothetical protein
MASKGNSVQSPPGQPVVAGYPYPYPYYGYGGPVFIGPSFSFGYGGYYRRGYYRHW